MNWSVKRREINDVNEGKEIKGKEGDSGEEKRNAMERRGGGGKKKKKRKIGEKNNFQQISRFSSVLPQLCQHILRSNSRAEITNWSVRRRVC